MYFFSVNDRKYEIVHLEISQSEAECGYAHLTVALSEDANDLGNGRAYEAVRVGDASGWEDDADRGDSSAGVGGGGRVDAVACIGDVDDGEGADAARWDGDGASDICSAGESGDSCGCAIRVGDSAGVGGGGRVDAVACIGDVDDGEGADAARWDGDGASDICSAGESGDGCGCAVRVGDSAGGSDDGCVDCRGCDGVDASYEECGDGASGCAEDCAEEEGVGASAYGTGCIFRESNDGARDVIISGDASLVPVDGGLYFVEIIARPIEQPSAKNLYKDDLYTFLSGAPLLCRNPDNDTEMLAECLSASGEVLFCDMKTRQVRRSPYVGNCADAYVLEREDVSHLHVSYHEQPVSCVNLEVICQYYVHENEHLDVIPALQTACGGKIQSLNVIDWHNVAKSSPQCRLVSNTMRAKRRKIALSQVFEDHPDGNVTQYLYDGSLIFQASYDRLHREKATCKIFAADKHLGRAINLQYVVHDTMPAEKFFHSLQGYQAFQHCIRKAAQHIVASERNQSLDFHCNFELMHEISLGSSVIVKDVCGKNICGKVVKIVAVAEENHRSMRVKISCTQKQMWEQKLPIIAQKNGETEEVIAAEGVSAAEAVIAAENIVLQQECTQSAEPIMQIDDVQVRNVGDEQLANLRLCGCHGDLSECDTYISLRIKKSAASHEEDLFRVEDVYVKAYGGE